MIVRHFSVYDKKTNTYGQIFPSQTYGSAERSLKMTISNDSNSMIAKYPEDYSLFFIGEFDDESGIFASNNEPPQLICHATSLLT